MKLTIPDPALVLLVGPAGAGKSTFAQAHFRPTEIISSDAIRAMLADDPADQSASAEAFQILSIMLNGRLRRRLTTVVDATNLRSANRRRFAKIAGRHGVEVVVIAFDLPAQLYLARNAGRTERIVEKRVVAEQAERMRLTLADLVVEEYAAVHVLREPDTLGLIQVGRGDRRERGRES